MNVEHGGPDLQFASDVRRFLAENPALVEHRQFFHGRGGNTRRLYQALGSKGWLSLTWPRRFGGQEASPTREFVLWDELAYARAARPDLASGIVAKSLIEWGDDDQRARYLPGIRKGDLGFALGYSEPEAGSDLSAVRTRATRAGADYVVSGEKRWTSDAHNSKYLWLLCRTGRLEDRGRALTLLILDLESEGVTIRPIETIDGHALNEVFLDEVHVPAADRVGQEGEAWSLIREALALERHLMILPGRLRRDLEDYESWSRRHGIDATPEWQASYPDLVCDLAEVQVAAHATLAAIEAGRDGVVEAARAKLLGSRLAQRIPATARRLGGPAFLADDDVEFLWRESVMETIAGGTTEIMQGVIARTSLGLEGRR